jgi:glycerol-3-phosphate dehydrogenase
MTEFSWRTRQETHARLARELHDILIIGGGITGAGLALDAAARGLRVALVEKRDFAAGTSSRSTKLIHGGLRYLEHFEFALVREGLRERALLARLAPHLVEPCPFAIPIYQSARRNYDHPLKVRAGLWLYDLLAGRLRLRRHARISRAEALKLAPQLEAQGLRGAFVYYDGRTDDARLVIEVIKSAHARGADLANYTRLVGLIQDAQGRIVGARLRDELTGAEFEARARLVINATGVWTDEVRDLEARLLPSPTTTSETLAPSDGKRVRPSKGIHLVVAAERLRVNTAWLIPSLTAHRFYFVVPWEGRVLIGTTDTDYRGSKDAPRAEADEVNEILQAINSYFPGARLDLSDVISTFAGLRPLISDGKAAATTDVSREEEIFESRHGLVSIAGGKLTTYRRMAERVIDLAVGRLSERFGLSCPNSQRTIEIALSGGALSRDELERAAQRLVQAEQLSSDTARHLVCAYGADCSRIVELTREDERYRASLVEGLPHLAAEVIYAVRHEMALALADVLARRTRLNLLAGRASLQCAPTVADLMAQELGWDQATRARQLADFTAEYEREFATPTVE